MFTLLATLLSVSLALDDKGTIDFYNNGERLEDTEPLRLTQSLVHSAVSIPEVLKLIESRDGSLLAEPIKHDTRIFNDQGIQVFNVSSLRTDGFYYIVPADKHWMWPSVTHGHKVKFAIDDVVPSKDLAAPLTLESVNFSPRVFFIHNLLSEQEADSLIEHASSRVQRSTTGSSKARQDAGRTSEGTFDSTIPASDAIIKRVYKLLRVPYQKSSVDGLQIVRYKTGKFYNEHLDYLDEQNAKPDNSLSHATGGTNRYATVFFYLNDVAEGGQTGFTKAPHLTDKQLAKMSPELRPVLSSHKIEYNKSKLSGELGRDTGMESNMVKTCHEKLSVQPVKLGAVLFYNTDPSLVLDKMTYHTGCPVIAGLKWGANLWVWNDNKDGVGVPSNISLKFTNTLGTLVQIFWIDTQTDKRKLIATVDVGRESTHTSYNSHEFEMEVDGAVIDTFKLDFKKGREQHVHIPTSGPQPFHNKIQVTFMNELNHPVFIYWFDTITATEKYLQEIAPFSSSEHGTFHTHEFRFRKGKDDPNSELVLAHIMDGTQGAKQVVDVNNISEKIEVSFVNKLNHALSMYWFNKETGTEKFMLRVAAFGTSLTKTFHTHEFRFRKGEDDPNGALQMTYVMDGSLGSAQVVDITDDKAGHDTASTDTTEADDTKIAELEQREAEAIAKEDYELAELLKRQIAEEAKSEL